MNITFEQAIEEYLKYSKMKKKYDTYETIERRIKKHISPFFNSKKLVDISVKDYFEWQLFIEEKNFKYNYKSSLHYTFSDFYEYCYKFYGFKNIAKKVGNFKNDDVEEIGTIWTLKDFKKFISNIDDNIYHALFNLLYFTGLRKGEALALTFNDLNDNYLTINKTITRFKKNGKKIITAPKTKTSNRIISLDNMLIEELNNLKKYYQNNYTDFNNNFYIFGGNKEITFSTLLRKKNYYCDKANVKRIKIHELRHSHAILLYLNNVPIDQISRRLGHSKISVTTDIYLKYVPIQEKKVLDILNTLHSF